MNAWAILSNGRTTKVNGGGMFLIQAMQDNFEVVLEI
jgi:hypothetical protein